MKKLAFGFLALALAMGALLAVLPGQQVMADPGDVYVATTGDDLTGDGTAGNPYQTIDKGIDEAIAGDTVHVAAGTYVENITMKGGVVIQGAGADVTSINGTRAGSVVTSIGLDATAKLAGFTITNGSAFTGGGMYNENSSPVVTNCVFYDNTASEGGGMYNNNSSPTVTNCTFWDNFTSGGPAYGGDGYTIRSEFIDGDGGGMHNNNSSPTVTNCTFEGNIANFDGGGMYNWASSPTVTNCIFSENRCIGLDSGGGIYADGSSAPTLDYNNVWNNIPDDYFGCVPGPHDISVNPNFVNAAVGDFHLQGDSLCIDVGGNNAPALPATDFEGDNRVMDGDGIGGAVVDMGVDEVLEPGGEATDSSGDTKNTFTTSETVYATGNGFPPSSFVDVYIIGDLAWSDGMAIPPDVSSDGMNTVATDATGDLVPTDVWPPPLTPGEYDMVFDANQNGMFDVPGDSVDDPNHPGFVVGAIRPPGVPSLTAWGIAGIAGLFAVALVWLLRRRIAGTGKG